MLDKKPLKNLTVLYAEDDELTRQNITKTLQLFCDTVISVSDGEAAVEAFKNTPAHIVMLDYVMPKKDGVSAARAIRKLSPNVPIFIASSYTDKDKLLSVMGLGLVEYLEKPLHLSMLTSVLAKCLDQLYKTQSLYVYLTGGNIYDTIKKEVITRENAKSLTKKEHLLMDLFLTNKDFILSKEQIEEHLYPEGAEENALRNLIYRLRQKCGHEAVMTIKERGYALCIVSS